MRGWTHRRANSHMDSFSSLVIRFLFEELRVRFCQGLCFDHRVFECFLVGTQGFIAVREAFQVLLKGVLALRLREEIAGRVVDGDHSEFEYLMCRPAGMSVNARNGDF